MLPGNIKLNEVVFLISKSLFSNRGHRESTTLVTNSRGEGQYTNLCSTNPEGFLKHMLVILDLKSLPKMQRRILQERKPPVYTKKMACVSAAFDRSAEQQ